MGLLRLQNNPLVHVVSRNGLLCVACARRKVHLSARRHVGELPVAAAYGGASQKVIAVHAAQDGARYERRSSPKGAIMPNKKECFEMRKIVAPGY